MITRSSWACWYSPPCADWRIRSCAGTVLKFKRVGSYCLTSVYEILVLVFTFRDHEMDRPRPSAGIGACQIIPLLLFTCSRIAEAKNMEHCRTRLRNRVSLLSCRFRRCLFFFLFLWRVSGELVTWQISTGTFCFCLRISASLDEMINIGEIVDHRRDSRFSTLGQGCGTLLGFSFSCRQFLLRLCAVSVALIST